VKALIALLTVVLVLTAFGLAFYVYRDQVVKPSSIIVKGYSRPCSGCVFVNLSIFIDVYKIVFAGYFDEQLMNNSLETIVYRLADLKDWDLLHTVRELAVAWSIGPGRVPVNITYSYTCVNSTCSITSIDYKVDLSWRLFTFKGGWCLYAVSRALYLLDLMDYTGPQLLVILRSPLHAILLLKENVGPRVYVNGYGTWYIYINYPPQYELDLSNDNILYMRIY